MRQISPIHTYATFWHSSCFPSIAKRKVEASVDVQCFNFENVPNLSKIGLQSDSSSVHSSAAVKNGTECAQNRESQKRANIKSIEDWRNYISKQV